jgi:soluble lytic murein transglycosylase-like protein
MITKKMCGLVLMAGLLSLGAGRMTSAIAEGRDPTDFTFFHTAAPAVKTAKPQRQASTSRAQKRHYASRRGGKMLTADPSREAAIRPLIMRHAAEQGVPFSIADAVVRVESRYNPRARNGIHIGLTQLNPRTARGMGYQGSAAGLYDPNTNLRYGMKYLAQAYRLAGGDTCGTIMRYHGGHYAKSMTGASRSYCSKVKIIIASR